MTARREAAAWRRLAEWYAEWEGLSGITIDDAIWYHIDDGDLDRRMAQRVRDHDTCAGLTNRDRVLACLFLACEAAEEG